MSTHSVNIIEIEKVWPHTNAERLEIVPVNGWQAVVKKGQFQPGDRAVYIQPDYMVPTAHEEFSFLAKEGREAHRLKAVRLRGVLSFGLLIPVPKELGGCAVGECVMERLGIVRYEPPAKAFKGGSDGHELPEADLPTIYAPKFDVESIQNFLGLIAEGEEVVVTEKIHGSNARYLWHDGKLFMGSRSRWLRPEADHLWARALADCPQIEAWCKGHPDTTLFGEVFGPVQSLKYGRTAPTFAAFAALHRDQWVHQPPLFLSLGECGVPRVPVLFTGPFDFEAVKQLAERDSHVGPPGHMMEGVVIAPAIERAHPDVGRVVFKHVSSRYWESDV